MAARNKQKLEMEKELCEALSLNASILQMKLEDMIGEHVLLDGGASHNVYYSSKIPEGSIER